MSESHLTDNAVNLWKKSDEVTKELDTKKLQVVLKDIGITPRYVGYIYIIEELKFYFENELQRLSDNLSNTYKISAKLHNLPINRVQWNVQYALGKITIDGDKTKVEKIFYWHDFDYNISPKIFFETMINYMSVHRDEFTK